MFVGECKLYIINNPDLTQNITEGEVTQTVIKSEEYKNFEHNSLILNIGETPHKFYAVNDSGDITFVELNKKG
jgi:hypothetical protein